MARPNFGDVTALVRQLVDDRDQGAGIVFTDALLVPFGNSAQRRIFRQMRQRGLEDANSETTRTVTSADTQIDWTVPGGQVLPDDFVRPLVLWEKLQGQADTFYVQMSNAKERLPDVDSSERLLYWMWEDTATSPAIKFIAPTTTRTVRILYQRQPPVIVDGTTTLYIPDSTETMASCVAWLAAVSRGENSEAAYWKAMYDSDLDELMRQAIKGEQRRPRQRRPYGWMQYA